MTTERSGIEGEGSSKGTRRRHSTQYKRRVVLESLQPGASAREVAHRHGVHESLLGVWRRQHSQGRLQDAQSTEVTLLPVQVPAEAESPAHSAETSVAPRAAASGTIHIEFSHGHRLSVRGTVDANTLSVMLRELSRA